MFMPQYPDLTYYLFGTSIDTFPTSLALLMINPYIFGMDFFNFIYHSFHIPF